MSGNFVTSRLLTIVTMLSFCSSCGFTWEAMHGFLKGILNGETKRKKKKNKRNFFPCIFYLYFFSPFFFFFFFLLF